MKSKLAVERGRLKNNTISRVQGAQKPPQFPTFQLSPLAFVQLCCADQAANFSMTPNDKPNKLFPNRMHQPGPFDTHTPPWATDRVNYAYIKRYNEWMLMMIIFSLRNLQLNWQFFSRHTQNCSQIKSNMRTKFVFDPQFQSNNVKCKSHNEAQQCDSMAIYGHTSLIQDCAAWKRKFISIFNGCNSSFIRLINVIQCDRQSVIPNL